MEIYKNLSLEDMEGEVWKNIEGFEGMYQVSNMGRIKSLKRVKRIIVRQSLNRFGYLQVVFKKENARHDFKVHRLVAGAFLNNPENKPTVDHINAIRTDNRLINLRYATYREQMMDNAITRERSKKISSENGKKTVKIASDASKKKVRCLTTLEEFESVREASRKYKVHFTNITACCRGKRKHCGKLPNGTKLTWEYID